MQIQRTSQKNKIKKTNNMNIRWHVKRNCAKDGAAQGTIRAQRYKHTQSKRYKTLGESHTHTHRTDINACSAHQPKQGNARKPAKHARVCSSLSKQTTELQRKKHGVWFANNTRGKLVQEAVYWILLARGNLIQGADLQTAPMGTRMRTHNEKIRFWL